MRKGELAEHAVTDVLRTAAAERLSGQIDLDGEPEVTVYLVDGRVALVCETASPPEVAVDDDLSDADYLAAVDSEESRLRATSVETLRAVVGRSEGWYYHHPLGEHQASALWGWDVDELLGDACRPTVVEPPEPSAEGPSTGVVGPSGGATGGSRAQPVAVGAAPTSGASDGAPPSLAGVRGGEAPIDRAPAMPPPPGAAAAASESIAPDAAPGTGRRVRLSASAPSEPIDDAAWSVLVALSGAAHESQVVDRLGWPDVQADIVVSSMIARGILVVDEN